MQQLKFTRKVRGIHTAQLNGNREIVLHQAGCFGWRASIRDIGAKGFGTDLRLTSPTLGEAKNEAGRFASSLITL